MKKFLLQPVVFDGFVYVMIGLFTFLNSQFGGEEASKYFTPKAIWIIKTVVGSFSVVFLGVKMYRSTTFAEYRQAKNGSYHTGDTQQITKQQTTT